MPTRHSPARLDDPDGFVVGRAITSLKDGNLLVALEPLLRVADKHPELAAKVIETLTSGPSRATGDHGQGSAAAAEICRAFPRRRQAPRSSKALADPAEKTIEPEVLSAALVDPQSEVRIAAAQMLLAKLNARRPKGSDDSGRHERDGLHVLHRRRPRRRAGHGGSEGRRRPERDSVESWLTRFQEGKARPAWMEPAIAPLAKMLKAESVEEQIAAALPLIALGRQSDAMPALIAATRKRPRLTSAKPPTPCPGSICASGSSSSRRFWP